MPVTQPVSGKEQKLLIALGTIVEETMDFPARKPYSGDSHLPAWMISQAKDALDEYGYETGGTLPPVAPQAEPALVPTCVRCNYISRADWEDPYCNHPMAISPIYGTRHRLCHDERESCSPHAYCGVSGKGFRERQADDAQTKASPAWPSPVWAPPVCVDCKHAKRVSANPTEDATELFCVNPKMGWRSGVGSGVKCLVERSYHNTLAGCGTAGRLFEAANTSEVTP